MASPIPRIPPDSTIENPFYIKKEVVIKTGYERFDSERPVEPYKECRDFTKRQQAQLISSTSVHCLKAYAETVSRLRSPKTLTYLQWQEISTELREQQRKDRRALAQIVGDATPMTEERDIPAWQVTLDIIGGVALATFVTSCTPLLYFFLCSLPVIVATICILIPSLFAIGACLTDFLIFNLTISSEKPKLEDRIALIDSLHRYMENFFQIMGVRCDASTQADAPGLWLDNRAYCFPGRA